MARNPGVENDVYERYRLRWADFPALATPSAHSDKAELFCAQQSLAAYAAYPSAPYEPERDYIPSRLRDSISTGTFDILRMIEGEGPAGNFDAERGYRVVVTDRASALLVWQTDHLVVAFRGTANWQDWIHNFTAQPISTELVSVEYGARLHKGFTGLAENIAPAVRELIGEFVKARKNRPERLTLTLCGHSLGGALALNFAARFRHWLNRERNYRALEAPIHLGATYTFGAPRIGKGEIWNFIHRPHYRLIVRGDPVPSTPFSFTADYQATYLANPLHDVQRQPKSAVRKLLRGAWTAVKPAVDVDAHDIEIYIEAIRRKIAKR